jgi:hypothetical protein
MIATRTAASVRLARCEPPWPLFLFRPLFKCGDRLRNSRNRLQCVARLVRIRELRSLSPESPVDEALEAWRQTAEGLEAAYEKRFLGVFAKPLKLNIIPLPSVI